jgi:CheY-like chemotaxis protein
MIDGRIHALARAHNQITDDHWGPAPLLGLIDAEAAAFVGDRKDRVTVEGSPILLNPQAYATMALVIHELVTNSVKYGALGSGGHVAIGWSRNAEADLVIDWIESGGAAVEPPTRRGFGTTIIEQSVPYDLGGSASIDYHADGVRARFIVPGRHVTEVKQNRGTGTSGPASAAAFPGDAEKVLDGLSVLLVEDSLIIALDAEDILRRLGAHDVFTDGNVASAIAAIDADAPDIAILDINLGSSNSFPIADYLDDQGIPFMFATGYGERGDLPERHRERIVMQKPYTLQMMARALPALAEQAAKRRS